MSEQQSKSFTFRIPGDVQKALQEKVGDRERSRFVVQALRYALGLEEKKIEDAPSATEWTSQVTEILYKLEVLTTGHNNVLQRLAALEDVKTAIEHLEGRHNNVLQRLADLENQTKDYTVENTALQSKTESTTELATPENPETEPLNKVVLPSNAESKTEIIEPLVLQLGGLEEDPKNATKMSGGELLRILQKANPGGKWTDRKLREIRNEPDIQTSWKVAGNCKFKRTGEPIQSKKIGYTWWVVYPYKPS
jgi:hypothetical protein